MFQYYLNYYIIKIPNNLPQREWDQIRTFEMLVNIFKRIGDSIMYNVQLRICLK